MVGLVTTTKILAKKVVTLKPYLTEKHLVEIQGEMSFEES